MKSHVNLALYSSILIKKNEEISQRLSVPPANPSRTTSGTRTTVWETLC